MGMIRNPAVAGMFYPAQPEVLLHDVRRMLESVSAPGGQPVPKAIIVPHAGYIYSGPIAASIYARLAPARRDISRVVLIGPSHHVAFRGVALSGAEAFTTPLGRIPIDQEGVRRALEVPGVGILDAAHAQEHSLEVQLPFLQAVLDRFSLVPMVAGDAPPELVAAVLEALWGGRETLIVISSDLSHYLDYASAQAMDAATRAAIEHLDAGPIGYHQACGRVGINGLLRVAKQRGIRVETVDVRNSGDTAGQRDRVVGYGAWSFIEPQAEAGAGMEDTIRALAPFILALARDAVATQVRYGQRMGEPEGLPPPLRADGACFVTLTRRGQLRGCLGSAVAWRPLATDIIDNAAKTASQDPRFPPVSVAELDELDYSVSILTPPVPMVFADEADLLAQLRPRRDGLIIEDKGRRALFLPAVWEQVPAPRNFLEQLKLKAGLPPDHWSPDFRAQRFAAIEIK